MEKTERTRLIQEQKEWIEQERQKWANKSVEKRELLEQSLHEV